MKKYIIKEVPAGQAEFSNYFDVDGLTEVGGDYCYNLFIVAQSRNSSGFNEKEYQNIQAEIEELLEGYTDIVNKSDYAQYSSIGAMLLDHGLIDNIHNTKHIKAYTQFFADCCEKPHSPYGNYPDNFIAHSTEKTAEYLTLKTGKQWDTDSATGYSQSDYVKMVYCKEHYTEGVKHYGEIWLGAAKEFSITFLNGNGEEEDTVYGYIVADCQARKDEDYKKLICEWEGVDEEEAELQIIDGQSTVVSYSYRTV